MSDLTDSVIQQVMTKEFHQSVLKRHNEVEKQELIQRVMDNELCQNDVLFIEKLINGTDKLVREELADELNYVIDKVIMNLNEI